MQTSVFYKKRICFVTAILLILIHLFTPIATYADNSSKIEDLYAQAEKKAENQRNQDDGEEDKTAIEQCQEMIKELRGMRDSIEANPTIRGGYDIIDEIKINGDFGSLWKSNFREEAQSLGIEFGDLTGRDDGQKMNDEIQDSAVKVNILTWNNNTVGGEQVQTVNSGAIQDMIDGIEKSGILTNFMTPLAAIGIALVIAFGGASLINLSMERSVTNEAVTREFIKIVIGVFIIYNCRTFALAIISAGSWVIEKLQLSFTNTSYADSMEYALVNSFIQTIEENNPITEIKSSFATGVGNLAQGLLNQFGNIFNSFSGFIGNGIIQLASSLAIYSVAIEIGVRYVFTPIAIADLYSEKFRSNGVMWLKKLLACVLTGAVIYMIIFVTDAFKDSVGATFSVITNMAINLTMIGMLFRARQIANDIVGCH